jgi:DNA-directed RNA polymerase subunit RPC12/RpoP
MTSYWCKWCGWKWQARGVVHVRCIMCGMRLEK